MDDDVKHEFIVVYKKIEDLSNQINRILGLIKDLNDKFDRG